MILNWENVYIYIYIKKQANKQPAHSTLVREPYATAFS